MIRIKFIKAYKTNNVDDVIYVTPNEAFGLIDSGVAVVSKDMTSSDYSVARNEIKTQAMNAQVRKTKRK